MSKFVYVLVSDYNDYNQHGEYFEGLVLEDMPEIPELAELVKDIIPLPNNIGSAIKILGDLRDLKRVIGSDAYYRFIKTEIGKVYRKQGEE